MNGYMLVDDKLSIKCGKLVLPEIFVDKHDAKVYSELKKKPIKKIKITVEEI